MDKEKIICLRMERKFLSRKANEAEFIQIYRDMRLTVNIRFASQFKQLIRGFIFNLTL